MTMPDIPGGEAWQAADEYDPYFGDGALPGKVAPYNCDHDADPPVCQCVHDWRINWGNVPKKTAAKATYIQ